MLHFFLNFGQIGNFNKYSNFPLQEATNRRVLLWNEPVFESSAQETLKEILGGDTSNVKVKFRSDTIIQRTPVIILCNRDVIPHTQPFNDRCFRFTWSRAPYLKSYNKKPYPLCIHNLFQYYNIID